MRLSIVCACLELPVLGSAQCCEVLEFALQWACAEQCYTTGLPLRFDSCQIPPGKLWGVLGRLGAVLGRSWKYIYPPSRPLLGLLGVLSPVPKVENQV